MSTPLWSLRTASCATHPPRKLLENLQHADCDTEDALDSTGPTVRVVQGHACWSRGQLEDEIARGLWVVASADAAALGLLGEGVGGRRLWGELLQGMGGPFADMARITPRVLEDLSDVDVRASVSAPA